MTKIFLALLVSTAAASHASAQSVSMPSESAPVVERGNEISFEPRDNEPSDWETHTADHDADDGGDGSDGSDGGGDGGDGGSDGGSDHDHDRGPN